MDRCIRHMPSEYENKMDISVNHPREKKAGRIHPSITRKGLKPKAAG